MSKTCKKCGQGAEKWQGRLCLPCYNEFRRLRYKFESDYREARKRAAHPTKEREEHYDSS